MTLKIAIVGAGPAGCILARLLLYQIQPEQLSRDRPVEEKDRVVSITVFESEQSIDCRTQGGSLDLHERTGILALKKAGLFSEFVSYARYDGEAMLWADKQLRPYIKISGNTGRPEIDRSDLRGILVDALPEGVVQWKKKLVRVSNSPDVDYDKTQSGHHWKLEFTDGTTASGYDLVVGADGAWSKVRSSALSTEKPFYSGIGGYILVIPNAKETAPEMYRLVNKGSCYIIDGGDRLQPGRSLVGQQLSNGDINIATWTACPENWREVAEYDIHDGAAVKRFLIENRYNEFHPLLLEQLGHVDEHRISALSLYMLPVGFTWSHQRGVTLLGDAAHLMTPFAGEGVNLAFEDAMHLCDAVKKSLFDKDGLSVQEALDRNVKAFEKNMHQRATIVQRHTFEQMKDLYLTPGSPGTVIERFVLRNLGFKRQGWSLALYKLTYPFLAIMVYTGYFIYKRFLLH